MSHILPKINNILILKMNRSTSVRVMAESKSPSRRGVYLNDQRMRKQKNTTFHSPYKDGKPNRDYINPSFLSSNLFYPAELPPSVTIQKNIIPNQNDLKKQVLYRQRLRTDADLREKERERSKTREKEVHTPTTRNRQFKQQRNNCNKIIRLNEPEKILSNQLQSLQNYRECLQQRSRDRSNRPQQQQSDPPLAPYFEKSRRNVQYELKQQSFARSQLNTWMAVSQQLKELKKEVRRSNQAVEHERTAKLILENQAYMQQQEAQKHREAGLLREILQEQMRTNELRRERRRDY